MSKEERESECQGRVREIRCPFGGTHVAVVLSLRVWELRLSIWAGLLERTVSGHQGDRALRGREVMTAMMKRPRDSL